MKGVKKAITLLVLLSTVIAEFPKKFINITGDVKVIGLFQIHETENADCGIKVQISSVMTAEAVKWYLGRLNSYGQLSFKIGFEGYQTCRQKDRAAELAIELMDRSLSKEGIAGIIGPEFSSEAEVISSILSSVPVKKRLAQVGFSTTAARLSDEDKFPNLIRVVPQDNIQVEVMIQSMIQLEWNRIAIIFEDDTYGQEASSRLRLRAEQENICVSVTAKLVEGISAGELATVLNNIIVGSVKRPPTGGIVFIGSSSMARSVLYTLNGAGFSSVPIVMLSEGTNMDTSIFRQFNGDVLSKTKGFLVLSPTYREVTEFTLHWKSIFTNKAYFEQEFATNPWLLDVYFDITQCEERNCKFTELTESEYNTAFQEQPLYIQYSIVASHTLVKGIKMLLEELCFSPENCTSFENEFRAGDVLAKLKEIHINMAKDFPWSLQSMSTPQLEIEISQDGEILSPESRPSYQLFNFRKKSALTPADFALVKIGDYVNTDLTIDTGEIRDYNSTGAELYWPYVRKGQCYIGTKCEECIPIQYLHESFIHEPGDIYVVAAVAVFDKLGLDKCGTIRKVSGYQVVEAIRFAIEKVNSKTGDFANMFPGVKVGLVVLNTCNNQVVIQRKLYDLHKHGITLQNGTVVTLTNKIIGVLGDVGSSISISIAEVLTKLKMAQISFASTSPVLSDRSAYPFFLRNISPDDAQAKAIVSVIEKLNADYVQIVYSVGAYGEGGKNKIKEAAYMKKICIVQEIPVEETGSAYEIYEKLRVFTHAQLVIIFLRSHRIDTIMSALVTQIHKGEFMFIGSEAWARKPLIYDERKRLLGSYTLSVEMYQDSELREHMMKLEPKPYNQNPWSLTYLETKRNCYFNSSFDKTLPEKCTHQNDFNIDLNFELDSWDTSAYVAAKCLLLGANFHLKEVCNTAAFGLCENYASNISGLVQEIKKIKLDLDGSGNKIQVFNANGDGNIGYRIYNIQRDDTYQNLIYVEVGRYPLEGTFTFEKHLTVTPTGAELVSKCPNTQACSGCFKLEDIESTDAKKKPIDVVTLILGGLLVLAIVIVIVLAVVLARQRKTSQTATDDYITPTWAAAVRRQEIVGDGELNENHNL